MYLQRFNGACIVNGYDNGERLRFLPARLEGVAYQVYLSIVSSNANITYPQLCDALTARFEPAEQAPVHEASFRMCRKKADETQFAFAAALRALADRAFRGQNGPLLERHDSSTVY